jgi:predicted Zn finger-like uncharacterized protein
MAITMNCPHCERAYTLADNLAGKKVRCKGCTTVFEVPASGKRREEEAVASDAPRRSARRDDYDDRDEYEDRPRRKGRKRGVPVWVWLVSGGGLLLLVGIVVVVVVLVGGKGTPGDNSPSIPLFGKSNRLTRENIEQVQRSNTEAEAVGILGSPNFTEHGRFGREPAKALVWFDETGKNPGYFILVANGKLVAGGKLFIPDGKFNRDRDLQGVLER